MRRPAARPSLGVQRKQADLGVMDTKAQSYERHRSHLQERYKKERAGQAQAGDGLLNEADLRWV